jgi:hypothetical protein
MKTALYYIICLVILNFIYVLNHHKDLGSKKYLIAAPVDDPFSVYYCNATKYKYFSLYATKCNNGKEYRFGDKDVILNFVDEI